MSQPYFKGVPISKDEFKELDCLGEEITFIPSNDHGNYCNCKECV